MINTQHLVKVIVAWTAIAYAICFLGVAMFPGIRPGFMMYGLHMNTYGMIGQSGMQNALSFGTFVSGLIVWAVVAALGAWLFAALWNGIKK